MSSNMSTSKNVDQLLVSKRLFESSPLKMSAQQLITMLDGGASSFTTVLRSAENKNNSASMIASATPSEAGAAPTTPKSTKSLREVSARRTLFPTSVVMNAHRSNASSLKPATSGVAKLPDVQRRSVSVAASLFAQPSSSSSCLNNGAEKTTTLAQNVVPSAKVEEKDSVVPFSNITPNTSAIAQTKKSISTAKASKQSPITSLNASQKARDLPITPGSILPIFGILGLGDTTSKSVSNSPAVLGKKVSIQDLFINAASTSGGGTQSTSSTSFQYKSRSEVFGGNQPHSPTKAGASMTSGVVTNIFATPTNRQHLRRQQSASATLVGGRYVNSGGSFRASVSSFRRFTPPPGKEISSPIYAASKFSESPSAKSLPMPPEDWIQDAVTVTTTKFPSLNAASIAEDVEENGVDGESTRPSFFLSNFGSESIVGAGDEGDASSTASSGVIFDLEEEEEEKKFPVTATATGSSKTKKMSKAELVDSGEGSLSSASDNEFVVSEGESTAPSPATPTTKKSGVRMNPFSLIAAVSSSPQIVRA